ncbi:MAG: glycosyltransferase family 2 protein [Bacteroidales bacterium]|nr:glycosyltransferase family 2 protein [Bacteroidales bacterium]
MNGELPSLDLAVATHRPEGIRRVAKMILPPADGITYVVSWQNHQDAPVPPELSARPDVKIFRFDGVGQSNNRNNAVAHCQAEIILHSDDDIIYLKEGLEGLRLIFKENPAVDVATFISRHGDMTRFPQREVKLTERFPKGYSVACFEIAFRGRIKERILCCPELGLGSRKLHGGEDEMFLYSAIKRGLDCRFFPLMICEHPHDSTGTKGTVTAENIMAFGCVIALTYPWSSPLRLPLKAWRLWRSGRSPLVKGLWLLLRGALMAPGVLGRNHDSLW